MDSKVDFVFIGHVNSEKRVELLYQTLDSYCRNTNFDIVGNVVFVDDYSPISFKISNQFFQNLFFIRNTNQLGVGGSKNAGISFLTELGNLSKFIYFSDSDVYFTKDWLDILVSTYIKFEEVKILFKNNELKTSKLGILGGGCHPYLQTNNKIWDVDDPSIEMHTKDAISGWSWLTTWGIINKYGYLVQDALGSGQSEDWEYCQRLKKDGYEVGSIYPEVVFHTGITNTEGKECVGANLFPRLPNVLYL